LVFDLVFLITIIFISNILFLVLMEDLEGFAREAAKRFSAEYRTARNPKGKECIVVFGGKVEERFDCADLIRCSFPTGIDAYVVEQETKRLCRERDICEEVFYVDLNNKCLDSGDRFYGQRA
jgi:hypothetical protein